MVNDTQRSPDKMHKAAQRRTKMHRSLAARAPCPTWSQPHFERSAYCLQILANMAAASRKLRLLSCKWGGGHVGESMVAASRSPAGWLRSVLFPEWGKPNRRIWRARDLLVSSSRTRSLRPGGCWRKRRVSWACGPIQRPTARPVLPGSWRAPFFPARKQPR